LTEAENVVVALNTPVLFGLNIGIVPGFGVGKNRRAKPSKFVY